jgi:hypothetical protein
MPSLWRSTAGWHPVAEPRPPVFNPRPRIESLALADGQMAWVIDEVLLEPEALVELAVRERHQFAPAPHNAYPGLEWRMPAAISDPLNEFFMLHIRSLLNARRTLSMYSRLSLATLQPTQLRPLQRICHRDRFGVADDQSVAACTLYLFKDPDLGGTSFFRPRQSLEETNALIKSWNLMDNSAFGDVIGQPAGYITASNTYFELIRTVPAAFNRAVFYDGSFFHSSHINNPSRLSADPVTGRLTLNGFFICRRNAGAVQSQTQPA